MHAFSVYSVLRSKNESFDDRFCTFLYCTNWGSASIIAPYTSQHHINPRGIMAPSLNGSTYFVVATVSCIIHDVICIMDGFSLFFMGRKGRTLGRLSWLVIFCSHLSTATHAKHVFFGTALQHWSLGSGDPIKNTLPPIRNKSNDGNISWVSVANWCVLVEHTTIQAITFLSQINSQLYRKKSDNFSITDSCNRPFPKAPRRSFSRITRPTAWYPSVVTLRAELHPVCQLDSPENDEQWQCRIEKKHEEQ